MLLLKNIISQDEIEALVTKALQFILELKFTLTQSLPQKKLAALRQCTNKIYQQTWQSDQNTNP